MPPWAIAFMALWIVFLVFFVGPIIDRKVRVRVLATPIPRRHLWPIGFFGVLLLALLVLPPTDSWREGGRPLVIVGSAGIVAYFTWRYLRDVAGPPRP